MTPERWQLVKDIFDCALEHSPESRLAYIRERCGDDEELRCEVESLLSSDDETGSLLDNPLLETVADAVAAFRYSDQSTPPDDSFGPYVPMRILGEGGMGTVYLALQQEPIRREVALKVVKLGVNGRQVLERFEIERKALAMMDHPNIARVFDAGTSGSGRPYFVMEYVDGVAITQYCDRKSLGTRERLELFVQVCQALQHAHRKGIIHRDVKPSNILVAEVDGRPTPKVIDFGIARATEQRDVERESFTLAGQILGTPEYMSPEQANLDSRDIDTGTDVYSLGVVLYELLVGALPLDVRAMRKLALAEILRAIRETPVPKPTVRITQMGAAAEELARRRGAGPGQLKRELSGDLDWIVMKAIEKDRHCRYGSASEFAADIERYLKNEPVLAGEPGRIYRARKFVRRHKLTVGTTALVAASLVIGIVMSTWQAEVARMQQHRAELRSQEVRSIALCMLDEIYTGVGELSEISPSEKLATANRVRGLLTRVASEALQTLGDPSEQPYGLSRYLTKLYTSSHSHSTPTLPSDWFAAGYSPQVYEMGTDRSVFHGGSVSGYIASRINAEAGDWAALMQRLRAENYRGRRVRLSAFIRSLNIIEGAHLWLRADGVDGLRAFDGMRERPIQGTTDWRQYAVVLDIPEDSDSLSFGLLLIGANGKAWIDDVSLEVVTEQVPTTSRSQYTAAAVLNRPSNLGFENGYQDAVSQTRRAEISAGKANRDPIVGAAMGSCSVSLR